MLQELESFVEILESKHAEIKDVLEEIGNNPAVLNWRPNSEGSYSIFALAAEVALQEDYWISHVVGERAEPPGIDKVDEAQGDKIEPLVRLLDAAFENNTQILNQLTAADLRRNIELNDDLIEVRWCLYNALQLAAENYGRIATQWKWWQQDQDSIN